VGVAGGRELTPRPPPAAQGWVRPRASRGEPASPSARRLGRGRGRGAGGSAGGGGGGGYDDGGFYGGFYGGDGGGLTRCGGDGDAGNVRIC